VTGSGVYQRVFGGLVTVDGSSRPRSTHVNFDPAADMVRTFQDEYINLETAVGVFEVERIVHFHRHDARSETLRRSPCGWTICG
jgi:hypothetical protein